MSEPRVVASAANLPNVTFGHRSLVWWGTLGFILIEGSTLFICAASYFYLHQRVSSWPPAGTPRPALVAPSVQILVMALSIIPIVKADQAARRLDVAGVRTNMVLASLFAVAMCVVRGFEFVALNVRWDTNAYGSVAWATVVAHATLLLLETAETIVFTLLVYSPNLEQRDIAGISDNTVYWCFMTSSWVLLAVVVYFLPYLS
ncbi:MAG: cytochrome c oxidase subunit 3 [Gemmatimonadales bacterium]